MNINIIEYFHRTVTRFPNKQAIVDNERSLTFHELDFKVKQVASYLSKFRLSNKPIAVFLPKSIESVICNIAITYSGNIYMNLDIKNPSERVSNIINLIQPSIIITDSKNNSKLEHIDGVHIILFDEIILNESFNEEFLNKNIRKKIDTDPYCIINTSGSTGTPKGVVLNHRSFIDFIERSSEVFNINENDIIGSLSPLIFDIYSIELCFLMAFGAKIIVINDSLAPFPIEILKIINKHQVTFIFWVPTIMVNIANMDLLSKIDVTSIKTVWFAGEVFPTTQFNYWYRKLKDTVFANLYGPIEITLDCTYFIINRDIPDNEPIPIGNEYRNTDILILDENDNLAAEGELCVRGSSLAMGYYNNPEKTSQAFVQNPLNTSYPELIYRTGDVVSLNSRGEIVFRGRKDNLIKHQGYRIELDEIEHVIINTLKLVQNGCIVYNKKAKKITLFYENNFEVSPADFRIKLTKVLPKYMIPTEYIYLSEMPRNANGKIDRLKLKNLINNL